MTVGRVDGWTERSTGPTERELWRVLVCPACRGALVWMDSSAACRTCSHTYSVVDGIPVLLSPGAPPGGATAEDRGSLISDLAQKHLQAEYFDHEDTERETARPHGHPALYGWLILEKFRRSLQGIGPLRGISAVTVCAGSGMDAELLAIAGASVIAVDISLGAARRARARSRRYGAALVPVVADAERLPLRDEGVHLAYVHDGLHHLANPHVGIREMARVASRDISITEPARALATAVAVKLRLAVDVEDAGNRVSRMSMAEIGRLLSDSGFTVTHAERYAMYYRHAPGRAVRALSRQRLLPLAMGALRAGNRAAGRVGNKLTVQATRHA